MLTVVEMGQLFPQSTQGTLAFLQYGRLRSSGVLHTVAIELIHVALCELYPKAKPAFCHFGSCVIGLRSGS